MSVVAKTMRIDDALNESLKLLGERRRVPVNSLIVDALVSFVETELAREETDLLQTLEALRAYRKRHKDFTAAIDESARSEGELEFDPAEGELVSDRQATLNDALADLLDG